MQQQLFPFGPAGSRYKDFGLKYPTNADAAQHMATRQAQNRSRASSNPNEQWMLRHLCTTGFRWRPQAVWGTHIFDFWCHALGVAVEVDGPEHHAERDAVRDAADLQVSCIVVLRVRNRNEDDALAALAAIATLPTWSRRRVDAGKRPIAGSPIE